MGNNLVILKEDINEAIVDLFNEVIEKTSSPQDKYEIAAILESIGWNDIRVQKTFGVEDVFELSSLIWEMVQQKVKSEPFVSAVKLSKLQNIILIVKSFLRGMIFALPMAISVASMLTLKFSLWSYEYLSTEIATSIAIGTILSFITVGGFTQAIARRGFFYLGQGFYNMAKRITYYLMRMGYITSIIVGTIYLLFNLFFYNFTIEMLLITMLYYLFLTFNWLSVTVMYILKREFTFTALITAGIFLVYILFKILKLNIILSQIISLAFISIVGFMLIVYFFNKEEDKKERGIAPVLPKKSIMMYSLAPFFNYGFLYFTFLFIDRIIAWSTNNMYMPYIIWFRGDYELGLDFALLTIILPMGFSEVIVTKLMENLQRTQKNSMIQDMKDVRKRYIGIYINNTILISSASIISAFLIYAFISYINANSLSIFHTTYLYNKTTYFVFIWGLISYSILVLALTNSIILFSLSQPKMVTKVVTTCLFTNFIMGFLLSRWIDYSYAIFGLFIGCIVFWIGTAYYVLKVLNNLDYYIYAAL